MTLSRFCGVAIAFDAGHEYRILDGDRCRGRDEALLEDCDKILGELPVLDSDDTCDGIEYTKRQTPKSATAKIHLIELDADDVVVVVDWNDNRVANDGGGVAGGGTIGDPL